MSKAMTTSFATMKITVPLVLLALSINISTAILLIDELTARLSKTPLPAMFENPKGQTGYCECKDENKFHKLRLGEQTDRLADNREKFHLVKLLNPKMNPLPANDETLALDRCIQAMFDAICCDKTTKIGEPGKIKTVDDVVGRLQQAPTQYRAKIDQFCQVALKYPGEVNTLKDDVITLLHKMPLPKMLEVPSVTCECTLQKTLTRLVLEGKTGPVASKDPAGLAAFIAEWPTTKEELTGWRHGPLADTTQILELPTEIAFVRALKDCLQVVLDAVCCSGGVAKVIKTAADAYVPLAKALQGPIDAKCSHKYSSKKGNLKE